MYEPMKQQFRYSFWTVLNICSYIHISRHIVSTTGGSLKQAYDVQMVKELQMHFKTIMFGQSPFGDEASEF